MSFALGVIGDRWALLVVRELMFTAKRFAAIRSGLPGVTPSVLTQRLAELTEAGIIEHDQALGSYALTDSGRALRPVLHELGRWGAGKPGHDPRKHLSPSSLMLSLDVMLIPDRGRKTLIGAGFELGEERYTVRAEEGGLVQRSAREAEGPAVFVGDANAVAAALYSGEPVATLVREGLIDVRGPVSAAQRFADQFRSIPPALQPPE